MAQYVTQRQVGLPSGNVILDLHVLDQRIGALLEQALDGRGVTPAEYAIYSQLGAHALTPSELSERLGIKTSTLSGHLSTLRRRRHTRRIVQDSDRRSYRLELTATGRACLDSCRPSFRQALDRLTRYLDADVTEIRRLLAAVDAAAAEATESLARRPRARR